MGSSIGDEEAIVSFLAKHSKHPAQAKRAAEAVSRGCAKLHLFSPSGRIIYTVVGRSGDEFIDPFRPFCSCKNFFFRVLAGRNETCYHLLTYEAAERLSRFDRIIMHDEEFESFTRLLAQDLIDRKS